MLAHDPVQGLPPQHIAALNLRHYSLTVWPGNQSLRLDDPQPLLLRAGFIR